MSDLDPLVEVRQRAERAERLAGDRLTVLRAYVAHHSSCQECYGVWRSVANAEADEIYAALAADQPAEAGGERERGLKVDLPGSTGIEVRGLIEGIHWNKRGRVSLEGMRNVLVFGKTDQSAEASGEGLVVIPDVVLDRLHRFFKPGVAEQWLQRSIPAFEGATPIEWVRAGRGSWEEVLWTLEHSGEFRG